LQVHGIACDTERAALDNLGSWFPRVLALPCSSKLYNRAPAETEHCARHDQAADPIALRCWKLEAKVNWPEAIEPDSSQYGHQWYRGGEIRVPLLRLFRA